MSECKLLKRHYLVKNRSFGFECLLCRDVGHIDALKSRACRPEDSVAQPAGESVAQPGGEKEHTTETDHEAAQAAEALQLAEYLEKEEKELERLLYLEQLQELTLMEAALKKQQEETTRLREMKKRLLGMLALAVPLLVISMGDMMGLQLPRVLDPHYSPLNYGLVQFFLVLPIMWLGRGF